MATKRTKSKTKPGSNGHRSRNGSRVNSDLRSYLIPDYRLERPDLTVRQAIEKHKDGTEHVRYEVEGNLSAPVPPIRDSKYLDKKQCIEI